MSDQPYLLIARKHGSSSTRRQRGFPSYPDVERAVERWRTAGFNTWWVYGPRVGEAERPCVQHWQDAGRHLDGWGTASSLRKRRWGGPPDAEVEPTHPQTGEPTNAARAARVERAITAYAQSCYGLEGDRQDYDTVTQDFLTDLFHWMRQHNLDASDIAQRAANMVQAEVEQEGA